LGTVDTAGNSVFPGYNELCDSFSVGKMAMKLLCGSYEEEKMEIPDLARLIATDGYSFLDHPEDNAMRLKHSWSDEFESFLRSACARDPSSRHSAAELLGHKFLNKACTKEEFARMVIKTLDR
jgi:serine/threonine protein kinase